jgi:hypothetical protein
VLPLPTTMSIDSPLTVTVLPVARPNKQPDKHNAVNRFNIFPFRSVSFLPYLLVRVFLSD